MRRRLLGGLVLVGVLGLAMVLWQRPNPFAGNQVVTAEISDADGLAAIGADVRVAGVPVGSVSGVSRRGDHAQLTLTLTSPVGVVHRDATIALRPRLMFEGTAYVELTLGSPGAPPLGSGVIGLSHSSTYVPFDDALSVLNGRTRGNVRTVSRGAAATLSGTAPAALRDAISRAPRLLTAGAVDARAAQGPSGDELRTAVAALGRDASAIAEQAPALREALADEPGVAAALGGHPLSAALGELPATTAGLRSGAGAAGSIVGQLDTLVPRLQPAAEQLEPTLAAVRPVLRQAAPVMSSLTPVLSELGTALTGAQQGAAPARAAMVALQPTLDMFQSTLLTALEKPTDLGTPAYLAFLGLFAGGGGASRPFGVDGQGHFMRFGLRFLTGVGAPLPPCTLLNTVSPQLGALLAKYGGCTS